MAWINRMWSAPNIVCVCVDKIVDGVMEGKLYHRYCEDSINFIGIDPILKYMDDLFERIDYPQSAVRDRSFIATGPLERKQHIEPVLPVDALENKEGQIATLLVYVRSRQRATWQGWLYWKEEDQLVEFDSELDLIKSLDQICYEKEL